MQGMYDRISELLLDNYVITGNADWIALRNQATTIFSVATSTTTRNAPAKTAPVSRALPPIEWDIDSTRILDVSMMLDGNYNATADPEWLEIGSRIRSCYRAASEETRKPLLAPSGAGVRGRSGFSPFSRGAAVNIAPRLPSTNEEDDNGDGSDCRGHPANSAESVLVRCAWC